MTDVLIINRFKNSWSGLRDARPVHAAHQEAPEGGGVRDPGEVQAMGGQGRRAGLPLHGQRSPGPLLLQGRGVLHL